LTHFGAAHDPAEHIERYRECLKYWGKVTQEILARGFEEAEASRAFIELIGGEIKKQLSSAEAEHYYFNAGLGLSWLGLARYYRKRAAAPA
jgi:hypothetical protein